MKLAKIVPIFKNGNTQLFNNYRPISILPAFSKILEKIVCNRLLHFLESKNILYKHQYGSTKNHNTIHPVIHLLKYIANANDKASKNRTLAVFLDLSKAFDTISHNILLKKLEHYGVRGQDIKHVNECKFLVIYLDTHLTWKRHIERISAKIYSAIFAINRARNFLSKHALRCLYFALVHSHLTYGIHVWGNSMTIKK